MLLLKAKVEEAGGNKHMVHVSLLHRKDYAEVHRCYLWIKDLKQITEVQFYEGMVPLIKILMTVISCPNPSPLYWDELSMFLLSESQNAEVPRVLVSLLCQHM